MLQYAHDGGTSVAGRGTSPGPHAQQPGAAAAHRTHSSEARAQKELMEGIWTSCGMCASSTISKRVRRPKPAQTALQSRRRGEQSGAAFCSQDFLIKQTDERASNAATRCREVRTLAVCSVVRSTDSRQSSNQQTRASGCRASEAGRASSQLEMLFLACTAIRQTSALRRASFKLIPSTAATLRSRAVPTLRRRCEYDAQRPRAGRGAIDRSQLSAHD
jgi:hypothetical protein